MMKSFQKVLRMFRLSFGVSKKGCASYQKHAFVQNKERQKGDLNQMIWKVPEQIAYLSRFYDIAAGDLIMSGTPAGVGPIKKGDVMECRVEGLDPFIVTVV